MTPNLASSKLSQAGSRYLSGNSLDSASTMQPNWKPQQTDFENLGILYAYSEVMLYGSMARGDDTPRSDIDLLALGSVQKSVLRDNVSLTVYEPKQLRRMAETGSLFVLHLRLEGHILKDSKGILKDILEAWRSPDIGRMRRGIAAACAILDSPEAQDNSRLESLTNVVIFLLRTVLYLRCFELGSPCFGTVPVAEVLADERILTALRRDRATAQRLTFLTNLLSDYLGELPNNPFGTLEALAVSYYRKFPMASELALRVLGADRIEYASAPFEWCTE